MAAPKIDWRRVLKKDEYIVWEGRPKGDFHISILEKNKMHHDVLSGPLNKIIIVLALIGIIAILTYNSGYSTWSVIWVLGSISGLLSFDVIRFLEARRTYYMASDQAIYIAEVSKSGQVTKKLSYEDIHSMRYVEYPDKPGEVYFLTTGKDLTTRDFATGEKRMYPTFEDIENASEVQRRIEAYWRKIPNNPQVIISPENLTERKNVKVNVAIILYIMVILVAFVYIYDFYIAKPAVFNDKIISTEITRDDAYYGRHGYFLTESGNRIWSHQFTIKEPKDKVAVILFTPIFEVVQSVRIDGREYMNGINMKNSNQIYGFLLFYEIVMIGCFLMLFHPKVRLPDNELFSQVIMITLFVTIVFAYMFLIS